MLSVFVLVLMNDGAPDSSRSHLVLACPSEPSFTRPRLREDSLDRVLDKGCCVFGLRCESVRAHSVTVVSAPLADGHVFLSEEAAV